MTLGPAMLSSGTILVDWPDNTAESMLAKERMQQVLPQSSRVMKIDQAPQADRPQGIVTQSNLAVKAVSMGSKGVFGGQGSSAVRADDRSCDSNDPIARRPNKVNNLWRAPSMVPDRPSQERLGKSSHGL